MKTLIDLLRDAAKAEGTRPALFIGGRRYSFQDLHKQSDAFAKGLVAQGVSSGDRISCFLPNGIEFLVSYLGALKAGAIFNPLNRVYRSGEIRQAVEDYTPRFFIADSDGWQVSAEVLQDAECVERIILVGDSSAEDDRILSWEKVGTESKNVVLPKIDSESTAGIFSTSGTTGRAKGAMLSHRNFVTNSRAIVSAWRWTRDDILVIALPLFHMHGLGVAFHGWMTTRSTLHVLPRFDAEKVLVALQKNRATMFFGVPTMYARLNAVERPERFDLSQMRLFVSGSAPLPPKQFVRFRERFEHEVLERYGMTETGMLLGNPYEGARVPGTVGFPFPEVEARLVDGEVQVRGPNVFAGYWQRPEETAESFDGDWFRTGDLGTQDEEGRFTLCGRRSELILVGGYNVYPREVEEAIESHPGVQECAVAGVDDDDLGQVPAAWIVDAESPATDEELAAWCADRLARYKVPRRFARVNELPRNAMGKVARHRLEVD
ncbi:AMP-binding protein [bacterium]|nr:AMP-binding protein [bacterium]